MSIDDISNAITLSQLTAGVFIIVFFLVLFVSDYHEKNFGKKAKLDKEK